MDDGKQSLLAATFVRGGSKEDNLLYPVEVLQTYAVGGRFPHSKAIFLDDIMNRSQLCCYLFDLGLLWVIWGRLHVMLVSS